MALEEFSIAGNLLRILSLDATPSTNNYATALLAAHEAGEGTLVLTFRQTQGRGHGKNVWESEEGRNLTFSLVLEPHFLEASRQFLLSQVVSLGLAHYLAGQMEDKGELQPHPSLSGEKKNLVAIKWPNDIYIGLRKIAGILIENSVMGQHLRWSVAGIGLNINQNTFPSHLPRAISLKMVTGREYDLQECLKELTRHIYVWYEKLRKGKYREINEKYLSLLLGREANLTYRTGDRSFQARVEGVDPFGQLLLRTDQGEVTSWPFKSVELVTGEDNGVL